MEDIDKCTQIINHYWTTCHSIKINHTHMGHAYR